MSRRSEDDSFVPWNKYWATKTVVTTDRGSFNTYSTDVETDFVVLCVHGAGHSGLSFSLLAKELLPVARVVAPDLKCHGETAGNAATDLSLDNLVTDVIAVARQILPAGKRLLMVGHSLGGSIAIRSAYTLKPAGVFVMDTIEGIAMAAMPNMKHILGSRPKSFDTPKDAIRYIGSSGEMMSRTSAAVSLSMNPLMISAISRGESSCMQWFVPWTISSWNFPDMCPIVNGVSSRSMFGRMRILYVGAFKNASANPLNQSTQNGSDGSKSVIHSYFPFLRATRPAALTAAEVRDIISPDEPI
jgi:pimeloyl-ACP methyl ester carboxylesterase